MVFHIPERGTDGCFEGAHDDTSLYFSGGDAAVTDVDDPVRPAGKSWFMGDKQTGRTLVNAVPEDADYFVTGGGVERPGGFVGEQEPAGPNEGAGNGDALGLAAGNLLGETIEHVIESHLGQGGIDVILELGNVRTVKL